MRISRPILALLILLSCFLLPAFAQDSSSEDIEATRAEDAEALGC